MCLCHIANKCILAEELIATLSLYTGHHVAALDRHNDAKKIWLMAMFIIVKLSMIREMVIS